MPVIKINLKKLEKLLEFKISREKIIETIPIIGSDIENIEENYLYVEFFPNRPDLYSIEGVARALKYFLEIDEAKEYKLEKSDIKVYVDSTVKHVRPYIVACLIEDVRFEDDEDIEHLIEFQEDLHWALGRNRRKVAIGIHDYDKILSKTFYYTTSKHEKFIPLNETREYTLDEILMYHETGKKYGYIIKEAKRYPVIKDSKLRIISFPPIINADFTRISLDTRRIFVEMTGTDKYLLEKAMNIFTSNLIERGCKVKSVEIIYDKNNIVVTPNLRFEEFPLKIDHVREILGLELNIDEISKCLKRMGYIVEELNTSTLKVRIPPYRVDIFHEIDLIEDVAIGYGYPNIKETIPKVHTMAKPDRFEELAKRLRKLLIGLGFNEVLTLTLTNREFEMKCGINKNAVEIQNPIGKEYKNLRTSIIPSLIRFLTINKYKELPIKIFEIGNVFEIVEDEKVLERKNLCLMIYDSKANINDVLSIIYVLEKFFNVSFKLEYTDENVCLKNRCGKIYYKNRQIGIFGELNPKILIEADLNSPVAFLEINLDYLT